MLLHLLTGLLLVNSIYGQSIKFPKDQNGKTGSKCTTIDDSPGICVPPGQCTEKVKQWELEGKQPVVCKFNGRVVSTVCCVRKCEEKCLGYSKPPAISTSGHQLLKRATERVLKPFVVGGKKTALREFPYMAALGWASADGSIEWNCGGSLISEQYVLTAAHCTSLQNVPPTTIKIGASNLRNNTDGAIPQTFSIAQIIRHPKYAFSSSYNDIALIKLAKPAVLGIDVNPVCLQVEKKIAPSDVTVIGYGHTQFAGVKSDSLLKADVKITSNGKCAPFYNTTRKMANGLVGSQLCAGDSKGKKDSCQGDSGGPLLSKAVGPKRIVGVTSFGKACASTTPSVYTRVSSYVGWIEKIVWK